MRNAPLIIVRGLPGSGKTSFADLLRTAMGDIGTFETDNFFLDQNNGYYLFDQNLLEMAHNWNMAEVFRFCRDFPTVPCVVANTFSTKQEMIPYQKIACTNNRPWFVVGIHTKHPSIHNVPDNAIDAMKARWERVHETYQVFSDDDCLSVVMAISNKFDSIYNHK